MAAARRRIVAGAFLAVVAGLISTSYVVVTALAAPVPPAPVVGARPASPTTATAASFTYSDSAPGLRFRCSLDGSPFFPCSAGGTTYFRLADGNHTFAVQAGPWRGPFSSAATYSWLVDGAAPSITVTFPAADGRYGTTTWPPGCAPAGICGTAADPSGVQSVAVGIYQWSSGKYWTGSSFSSFSPAFSTATGTTSWHYAFTPPQDGAYVVFVRATDNLGNTTEAGQLTATRFVYDTDVPAAPVIVSGPASPFTQTTVEFTFVDKDWPGVTFSCRLDSGPVTPCTGDTDHDGDRHRDHWVRQHERDHGDGRLEGEQRYSGLAPGLHCFYVYATDRAGNVSPTTTSCWTIPGSAQNFIIGGDLTSPLYPGTSEPLDLTFTNPNSAPITIASGAISGSNITITTNKAGCPGSNFSVIHGLAAAVTIPANATAESLQVLGVPQANWPLIGMLETHTNQDACQGATLTLTYSGIEASG
jgi:large repetitive protein